MQDLHTTSQSQVSKQLYRWIMKRAEKDLLRAQGLKWNYMDIKTLLLLNSLKPPY